MSKKKKKPESPCFVKLNEIKELGRLACAFERVPLPIFAMPLKNRSILSTQLDANFGRPIFYYVTVDKIGHFLEYQNSSNREEVNCEDNPNNPTAIYSPIIKIKKMPELFQKGLKESECKEKVLSIQLSELASLVKVSAYKTLFEEPPIPLFTFKDSKKWVLGAFARIDEFEDSSVFFHITLKSEVISPFIKYSPQKINETDFTDRIDEHGNIYIKIIKLSSTHPLVNLV